MNANSRSMRQVLAAGGSVAMLVAVGLAVQTAMAEKKVDVKESDLPPNIKKVIQEAVPGGKITKVEKEVEGEDPGQYDVELTADGKKFEVEITPEGEIGEVKEVGGSEEKPEAKKPEKKFTDAFGEGKCTFSSTGRNRFFILEPSYRLTLESRKEKVVITVLNETKKIGNVETRVVEEHEEEHGKLKEVSRNFYAICKEHGDVFYFGEEVDMYKDGKVVKHEGAWRADAKDSKAGLMMPGTILLGARFYQEIAPEARDKAEVLANDITLKTPAGTFENCIRFEETNPLEGNARDYKVYAPDIGMVQDEDLKLTSYGPAK